jgi:hypothetical protein
MLSIAWAATSGLKRQEHDKKSIKRIILRSEISVVDLVHTLY